MGRGRPPKADGERKSVDLRIPVTPDQKATVTEAAALTGQDMATWARLVLLAAAHELVASAGKRKAKKA